MTPIDETAEAMATLFKQGQDPRDWGEQLFTRGR